MQSDDFVMSDGSARLRQLVEASGGRQAICSVIQVVVRPDDNPDLRYLMRDYREETKADRLTYQAEDRVRLAAFGTTWSMLGIRAVATVYLVHGTHAFQRLTLPSAGCWGVESDSEPTHLQAIAQEEITDVRWMLAQLHVWVPDDVTILWDAAFHRDVAS